MLKKHLACLAKLQHPSQSGSRPDGRREEPWRYKFNPYCAALLVIYCSVAYIRINYLALIVTLMYRPTNHVHPFRHNGIDHRRHPNHGASRSPIGGNAETQPIAHRGTLVYYMIECILARFVPILILTSPICMCHNA